MTSKFRKERNYIALRGDFIEKIRWGNFSIQIDRIGEGTPSWCENL